MGGQVIGPEAKPQRGPIKKPNNSIIDLLEI